MLSASEAKQVMGRVMRMPFYHHYVTIEISHRKNPEKTNASTQGPFTELVESGYILSVYIVFLRATTLLWIRRLKKKHFFGG